MNSQNNEYKPPDGYRGDLLERLISNKIRTWSIIRVEKKDGAFFEGVLLPRSMHTADDYLTIKTHDTGYNIGVKLPDDANITEIGYRPGQYKIPKSDHKTDTSLPKVSLLGTGGTVASRLDYRTGAVLPAFTPEELFSAVPELTDIVNMSPKTIYEILSENFRPKYWVKTAEAVAKEIDSGADGVIIGHGTDTMSYTGSALSFFFKNLPVPVVIVGSQRSSDRPSSDGPSNIMNASTVAGYSDIAEVVVCMHGTTSDSYDLVHRATRVRKMHSSRRDAFRSVSDIPIAKINNDDQEITLLRNDYTKRAKKSQRNEFILDTEIDEKVTMLYFYPGMEPDVLEAVIDKGYHGIVIIGTGLGHVGTTMFPALERAQDLNIPIVVTVQPLFGFTQLRVYETGRDMLARGVIEGLNMLPEAAYPKLAWTLGHTQDMSEIKRIMQTNIAGEITKRELNRGYPYLQGISLEEIIQNEKENKKFSDLL